MAGSLPTIQVLLDNFLGSFPYDITSYVSLSAGLTWDRGRPDEQGANNAGTLSLTVNNTDGRFTLGSGTYGIGLNQKIRLKINGTTVWTGRVQAWPVSFPGKGLGYSTVAVTAVDDMARAARRTLRSSLEEEILTDNPTAYYTLGEAAGATQAGDSSRNGLPSLMPTGSGSAVVFGNGTGPADGLSAAQMTGGQYLSATAASNYMGSAWSVEVWVNVAAPPAAFMGVLQAQDLSSGAAGIIINTSGQVQAAGVIGSTNICDGLTHQIVATYDGGTFSALYVDGAFVGSSGASSGSLNTLIVGAVSLASLHFSGTISHVATYSTAILSTRVASHWSGGHGDFRGETPQARLTRVAAYTGIPIGTLDTAGSTLMGPAVQQTRSAADVFTEVAMATLGTVFVGGSGGLFSVHGITITGALTPDASLPSKYVSYDLTAEADMYGVVNYATGQATGSENLFTAGNSFSEVVHGRYPEDYTWNVSTDAQALDRLNWQVASYAGPQPRMPDVTLDLLTMSGSPASVTAASGLDLASFLHLAGMPSQSPDGGISDLIVQGMSTTIQVSSSSAAWSVTLNCSRHILYAGWILGDAQWGVLNGTTKLYV